jgi:hypothetical protein
LLPEVRNGSKGDIHHLSRHVRFTLESGQPRTYEAAGERAAADAGAPYGGTDRAPGAPPPVVPGIRTTAGDQHADGSSSFVVPSRLPAKAKAKTAKKHKDLNDIPF